MPEQTFSKGIDSKEKVKVESSLLYGVWQSGAAVCGQRATLEIRTTFVGEGAPVKVTVKAEEGGKVDTLEGKMKFNRYLGKVDVPEDLEVGDKLYFEFKLSKNGIKGTSGTIPVRPAIKVTNLKWSAEEARRGDILTLTADVEGIRDGEEVLVTINEYDEDEAHDKIVEFPGSIKDKKMEVQWEYEYHEDTDEIPSEEEKERYGGKYNPPEYFFTVTFGEAVFGEKQESGLLNFKDYIEIGLVVDENVKASDIRYVLTLPDGSTKEGNLDDDGTAVVKGIPPGPCEVTFPDLDKGDADAELE